MNKKNLQNPIQNKKTPLKSSNINRPLDGSFIKKQAQNPIQINLLKFDQTTPSKPCSKQNTDRTLKDPSQSCRGYKSIEQKQNLNLKKIILFKEKPGKSYAEIQRQKNNLKNLKQIDKLSYCQSKSIFNSDNKMQSNNESRLNITYNQINDFNNESILECRQNMKKQSTDSMLNQIVENLKENNQITQQTEQTEENTISQINQLQVLNQKIKQLYQEISKKQQKVETYQKCLMQSQEELTKQTIQLQKCKNDILQLNKEKQELLINTTKFQISQKLHIEKITELQIQKNYQISLLNQQSNQKFESFTKQLNKLRHDYNILCKQSETYRKELASFKKENATLRRQINKYKNLAEQVLQKANETDRDIQNSNYCLIKNYEIQIQQYKNKLKQQQSEKIKGLSELLQKTQYQLNSIKQLNATLQTRFQLIQQEHLSQLQLIKQNSDNQINLLKQKIHELVNQNNELKFVKTNEQQQLHNEQ